MRSQSFKSAKLATPLDILSMNKTCRTEEMMTKNIFVHRNTIRQIFTSTAVLLENSSQSLLRMVHPKRDALDVGSGAQLGDLEFDLK